MTQPTLSLTDDERAMVTGLAQQHDEELPELEQYDRWYEGTQRAKYMHDEVFKESGNRIPEVRIFLPQVAVDAIAERLYVQGIKSGVEDLDTDFHRVWTANRMDLGFTQAVTDALVMRRSYISVGTNEEDPDTPLVCAESPLELHVRYDPRTRKPVAGLRRWCVYDETGTLTEEYATLYLPDRTVWTERRAGGWVVVDRDDHKLGEVPIATLANRPRTSAAMSGHRGARRERVGRSDLEAVIPLAHSMNKLATDMMVAAERVAIPLRAIFGAGPDEFKDEKGNPLTPMQALMGGLLAIPDDQVKAFEFAAAQLGNFTGAMREMSNQAGSVTGLPPHYLGTPSDNPASAEAITGSESRLATRAEIKQVPFGVGVRSVARLQHRFRTGSWAPELETCRIDWRDVRTPTVGARADAAVKLGPKDVPILPMKWVRQELGYDDDTIEAMEEQDELAAARQPIAQVARGLADNQRVIGDGPGA